MANSYDTKATASVPQKVRCAIYARKSTEEGLAQPFNSLDAQRESALAYIQSQRHMGWTVLERRYEDGGYSGANLVRLVQNVTYLGRVRDAEHVYQGEHAGIVDAELWERANAAARGWQRISAGGEQRDRSRSRTAAGAAPVARTPSVPRISRLLALALKMEQMLQEGTVKNYTELARLGQVSPARITQVMNLLHLAPDIQEDILSGKRPEEGLQESALRKLSGVVLWSAQRDRWRELLAAAAVHKHPDICSSS